MATAGRLMLLYGPMNEQIGKGDAETKKNVFSAFALAIKAIQRERIIVLRALAKRRLRYAVFYYAESTRSSVYRQDIPPMMRISHRTWLNATVMDT